MELKIGYVYMRNLHKIPITQFWEASQLVEICGEWEIEVKLKSSWYSPWLVWISHSGARWYAYRGDHVCTCTGAKHLDRSSVSALVVSTQHWASEGPEPPPAARSAEVPWCWGGPMPLWISEEDMLWTKIMFVHSQNCCVKFLIPNIIVWGWSLGGD